MTQKKPFSAFLTIGLLFTMVLFLLQFYVRDALFCPSCDFDDKSALFKLFYRNDAASGYHSEPTVLNLLIVFGVSFAASGLILRTTTESK